MSDVWVASAETGLGIVLFLAVLADCRDRLIPNWAPAAILISFAGFGAIAGEWTLILAGLIAACVALVLGFVAFRFQLLGGGDVKLLAALAAWAGPAGLLPLLAWTAIAGGVLAVGFAAWALIGRARGRAGRPLRQIELPYGAAIAAGFIGCLVGGYGVPLLGNG